uniref:Filamentous hemagglutinin family N-terminal domain-containing protein n=1 Tax=Candidatus Kentrum sp. TUN TaxID=2126343 RepID=A0A450ZSS5_9GAMM|nr:MAG: filamentous hemagglutinin family N-terminal domain-containing protein [Candidatus Kentron sp. TUN]
MKNRRSNIRIGKSRGGRRTGTQLRLTYRKNKYPDRTDTCAKANPLLVLARSANMFRLRPITKAIFRILLPTSLLLGSGAALALPQGGQIQGGQGNITQSGAKTTIDQQSHSLAIAWDSFDITAGELVQFTQPSASSAVLNRIGAQSPSQIFGTITANGRVFLLNPNGVLFGETSHVSVGSLAVTGFDISTTDFMAGNYDFEALTGAEGGAIINKGLIEAATGGSITLVSGTVRNEGIIVANRGQINLASGRRATLDFDGDGLLTFAVDGEITQNPANITDAVVNTGEIRAQGGRVLLTGRAAQDVFTNVVNNRGIIQAQGIENVGGAIRLVGDANGATINSGTLDASGDEGNGGRIEVLGDEIKLTAGAKLDASGLTGGGTILVGGDLRGANPNIPNATKTEVAKDVVITVDATDNGDGGTAVVWADDTVKVKINRTKGGKISARGGPNGGDGGYVEVSANADRNLVIKGTIDATGSGTFTGNFGKTTNGQADLTNATLTGTINLNGHDVSGTDEIIGMSGGIKFTLTGTGSGNFDIASGTSFTGTFSKVEKLTGGAGTDSIIAKAGGNAFTITGTNAGSVDDGFTFTNIETLTGAAGTDSIIAKAAGNAFTITGANAGSVDDGFTFTNIEILTGAAGTDSIIAKAAGNAFTITGANAGSVDDGFTFTNIEILTGAAGTDSIIAKAAGNAFTITGANAGSVDDGFTFTNIETLTGAAGTDTLDFTNYATNGIVAALKASGTTDGWKDGGTAIVDTAGSPVTLLTSFDNINAFTGTAQADTFIIDAAANTPSAGDKIDGLAGTDILDFSGYAKAIALELTGQGSTDGVASTNANATTEVAGGAGILKGFDNIDTFKGTASNAGTDSLTVKDTVTVLSSDLIIEDIETLGSDAGKVLAVTNLDIRNAGTIGASGSDFLINVSTLKAVSSGAIYIKETDAVTLTNVDTTNGAITVTAGGAIVATAVDSVGGDISLTSTAGSGITVGAITAGTAGANDLTLVANAGSVIDADTSTNTTVDVTAKVLTATAVNGNITLDTKVNNVTAHITGTTSGNVDLTETDAIILTDISTANGSITVTAGGAITAIKVVSNKDADANDISLTGVGITVGLVSAAGAGDVTLNAGTGSIRDTTTDTVPDVIAHVFTADAQAGIDLDTTVTTLDASVTSAGDLNLYETDSIQLTDVRSANGNIRIKFGQAGTAGTVGGTLTVGSGATVTSSGSTLLQGGAGKDTFDIDATLKANLDGLGENDTFNIRAALTDSTVKGGSGGDVVNIRAKLTNTAVTGGTGNDEFNIAVEPDSITTIDGESGTSDTALFTDGGLMDYSKISNVETIGYSARDILVIEDPSTSTKPVFSSNQYTITNKYTETLLNRPQAQNVMLRARGGYVSSRETNITITVPSAKTLIVDAGGSLTMGDPRDAGGGSSFNVVVGGAGNFTGKFGQTVDGYGVGGSLMLTDHASILDSANRTIRFEGGAGKDTFHVYRSGLTSTLAGNAGDDSFYMNAVLTGTLKGGIGNDTFYMNTSLIGAVAGEDGTDTLVGLESDNTFEVLTTLGGGMTSAATLGFTTVENLTGRAGNDIFKVKAAHTGILTGGRGDDIFDIDAILTGSLDGGLGSDILKGAKIDFPTLTGSNEEGFAGMEAAVNAGFYGIDTLVGNGGGTLTGHSVASTWTLDGTTYGSGSNVLNISGFSVLQGGSGDDAFYVTADSTFNLYGGSGNDTFNISAALTGNVHGGAGIDNTVLNVNGSISGENNVEINREDVVDEIVGFVPENLGHFRSGYRPNGHRRHYNGNPLSALDENPSSVLKDAEEENVVPVNGSSQQNPDIRAQFRQPSR